MLIYWRNKEQTSNMESSRNIAKVRNGSYIRKRKRVFARLNFLSKKKKKNYLIEKGERREKKSSNRRRSNSTIKEKREWSTSFLSGEKKGKEKRGEESSSIPAEQELCSLPDEGRKKNSIINWTKDA